MDSWDGEYLDNVGVFFCDKGYDYEYAKSGNFFPIGSSDAVGQLNFEYLYWWRVGRTYEPSTAFSLRFAKEGYLPIEINFNGHEWDDEDLGLNVELELGNIVLIPLPQTRRE